MRHLYRIVSKKFADLEGIGGLYAPGWWHHEGHRVVYFAESVSLRAWRNGLTYRPILLFPQA